MVENKEKLTTEVTSVAREEERAGMKIEMPSADQLVARASMAFIKNRKDFVDKFESLSSRGKTRVINAVLDLPVDGVPVYLKNDDEKKAFAVGQRVIADRFIITQHYIVNEVKKQREAVAKAKEEETSKNTLDKEEDKS